MVREVTREFWPLVGRNRVVDDLTKSIRTAQGAVIAGAAGVGKSRVLAAVADRLKAAEFKVVEITGAQSAAALPLAPLLELINFEASGNLASLVLAELNRRSKANPLVIVVDDAQNLDEASAALLHGVALSGVASVLVSIRSGEAMHPAVTNLWKDQHLARIELEPLNRRQTYRLLDRALGPTSKHAANRFWQQSRGHPLFLRELIAAARANDALHVVDGVVQMAETVPMSDRLLEVIGSSLDHLGHDRVRGLAGLNLAQPIEVDHARNLFGPNVVQSLIAAGLAAQRGRCVEVAHPLYGEAAALRLPQQELDELTVQVARTLATHGERDPDATLLLLDLGAEVDLPLLKDASAEAIRLRQGHLATRLATALVEVEPSGTSWAQLGAAHAINREWDKADESYRMAVTLAQNGTEADTVWLGWIRSTFEYRDDVTLARDLALEAEAVLDGAAANISHAWSLRARMFSEPLLPVVEGLRSHITTCELEPEAARMVELDLAASLWHFCQPSEGLAALRQGQALADTDVVFRSRAMQVHNALSVWVHGFRSAEHELNDLIEFALETNDPDVAIHALAARILLNARAGRASATTEPHPALDSLTLGATVSRWSSLFIAEHAWAQCHLQGQQGKAAQTIALAELTPETVSAPLVEIVRSRLAPDLVSAAAHLETAVTVARRFDLGLYELLALREIMLRVDPTRRVIDRIAELAHRAGPGLASIYHAEAEAIAADDLGALTAAGQEAERYGANGLAWEIYLRAQIGHHRNGDFAAAFRAEVVMETLGSELPNQYAPIIEEFVPVLTERERQVIDGLQAGRTNRQIAELLFLSPQTVKRHLDRIFQRLDVHNRKDLAILATR